MVISLGRILGRRFLPGGSRRQYANIPSSTSDDDILLLLARFGAMVILGSGYIAVANHFYYKPRKAQADENETKRLDKLFEVEKLKKFNEVREEMRKAKGSKESI